MAGSALNGPRRPWGCFGCLSVVLLAVVIAGGAAAWARLRGPSEVSNSSVEFSSKSPAVPEQHAPPAPRDTYDDGANWPMYGGGPDRTRYLPTPRGVRIRPPLQTAWASTGRVLLEFPPVLCGRRLYLLRNDGLLRAIDRRTGRTVWQRRPGYEAASSPACGDGRVVVTVLKRSPRARAGAVTAYSTGGKLRWQRKLAGRSESSPLLTSKRVVFGTESGDVLALDVTNGRLDWRYRAGAPVKAGVARDGQALFVGDYAGRMHSFWLGSGHRRWRTDLGGSLYSTPAVAYDRVFVGNIDGSVSAVGEGTGKLAWRRRAAGYVYSSPAVAPGSGGQPTVFIGSYGGVLYALDARSGRTRWSKDVGGKISGGVTVVGDVVLYANLARKTIGARRANDGSRLFSFRSGGFDPGISDGRRLYLDSYTSVYHLVPRAQARRDARSLRRSRASRRSRSPGRASRDGRRTGAG